MDPAVDKPVPLVQAEPTPPPSILTPDAAPDDTVHIVTDRYRLTGARTLAFSRGGRWLLGYGADGVVQGIDASRGRVILELPLLPEQPCRGRALSRDGRRLLVRRGSTVRLINLWTSEERAHFAGEGRARCTLSEDGTRVVIARGRSITIFDPGKPEAPLLELESPVESPRVLQADGRAGVILVAGRTATGDPLAAVWGGSGSKRWRTLEGTEPAAPPRLGVLGKSAFGGCGIGKVCVWNTFTTQSAVYRYSATYGLVANDTRLLVSDGQGTLALLDLETGEEVATLGLGSPEQIAAIDGTGKRVAALFVEDGAERLAFWTVGEERPRLERTTPRLPVSALSWPATQAASGGPRFVAGPWHIQLSATGKRTGADRRPGDAIGSEVPRWAGKRRVEALDRRLDVSDAPTAEPLWGVQLSGEITGVALFSDDSLVAMADGQGWPHAADGTAGTSWVTSLVRPAAAAHPQKPHLALVDRSGRIEVRDRTGAVQWEIAGRALESPVAAFSASGDALAVAGGYRLVVYDAAGEGRRLGSHALDTRITSLALSPDGALAVVSDGIALSTWEVATGHRRARVFPLREGQTLVTGMECALLSEGARPWIRWRRGYDELARGKSEVKELLQRWTATPVSW
ncbi:MAG: WD40 repeat protein [Myxococcota bacterium]|jgi:WD40 repeat protein